MTRVDNAEAVLHQRSTEASSLKRGIDTKPGQVRRVIDASYHQIGSARDE